MTRKLPKFIQAAKLHGDITVRASLTFAVVCAPKGTRRSRIVAAANEAAPGSLHGWRITEHKRLEDGTRLPAQCLEIAGNRHWMLET